MKYVRLRDTRHRTGNGSEIEGIRLSCVIDAPNAEEADAIFEERWKQKLDATIACRVPPLPVRTTADITASAMTQAALLRKKLTPGIRT